MTCSFRSSQAQELTAQEHEIVENSPLYHPAYYRLQSVLQSIPARMQAAKVARPALAAARRTVPRTAIRTYAAPAADNSKPPVQLFGLDGTYASALVRPVCCARMNIDGRDISSLERNRDKNYANLFPCTVHCRCETICT